LEEQKGEEAEGRRKKKKQTSKKENRSYVFDSCDACV
jgi:hypothetical protein